MNGATECPSFRQVQPGFSFERDYEKGKDEWLTPPEIIRALGQFDLDPCAPVQRPWATAKNHFTVFDDGLSRTWTGRVWCNPPYASAAPWLARCAAHRNAIALVFARTETKMFFDSVWPRAKALCFLEGRLRFHHATGRQAKDSAGAPSVLIAFDDENGRLLCQAVQTGKIRGALVNLS